MKTIRNAKPQGNSSLKKKALFHNLMPMTAIFCGFNYLTWL